MTNPLRSIIVVAVVALLFYSSAAFDVPFYTRGEPREAIVVQSMLEGDSVLWPLRNATEIPSKPPMFHWLGALVSVAGGGVSELSARIPSVAAGALGVALTVALGFEIFGASAGLTAALVVGTCWTWVASATTARVDMVLTAFLTLALTVFFRDYRAGRGPSHLFFIACIGAVLSKGPLVGIALPGAIIGVFLIAERNLAYIGRLSVARVLMWSLLPLAWYVGGYLHHGMPFIEKLILSENLYRVVDAQGAGTGHLKPFYAYTYLLPLGMAPWSLLAPVAGLALWRSRGTGNTTGLKFLVVWTLTTFALMSMAGSKRPVYLLPVYPAVAVLIAGGWAKYSAGGPPSRANVPQASDSTAEGSGQRFARLSIGLTAVFLALIPTVILAECFGIGAVSWIASSASSGDRANAVVVVEAIQASRLSMALLSTAMLSIVGVQAFLAINRRTRALVASTALLLVSCFLVIVGVFQRPIAHSQTVKPMVARLLTRTAPDVRLLSYRASNYAVMFYADRPVREVKTLPDDSGDIPTVIVTGLSLLPALKDEVTRHQGLVLREEARHTYGDNPRRDPLLALSLVRRQSRAGEHVGREQGDDLVFHRDDGADGTQGDEGE